MSIASVRQSRSVSKTSGCSGTSMSPGGALSWQATWAGNTAASRSSDLIRWSAGATFLPWEKRSTARARLASHLQRTWNVGACSTAWVSIFFVLVEST